MPSTVSILDCADYSIDALLPALRKASLAAGLPRLDGRKVFLKPNCLCARESEKAATTHPAFLRAAIRLFAERGASSIRVGDSPAYQGWDLVAEKTGLMKAAREEGAEWVDSSLAEEVGNPGGKLVKSFELIAGSTRDSFLVSLPKLKTHRYLYYSGAVKNLFGLVPGFRKARFHFRFPEPADFSAMLVDLLLAAAPSFALMDAVSAMHGDGPLNGKPFPLGLVFASGNPLALDIAAASAVGYEPMGIPYLAEAIGRDLLPGGIEALGYPLLSPIEAKSRAKGFELLQKVGDTGILRDYLPKWLYRRIQDLIVPKPWFLGKKCALCGACAKICPASALELRRAAAPAIDYRKCIRCYCCHEVCPEGAVKIARIKPFH